uniref:Putative secreted protein n=1 Tax=Ixodes ricinus TaxID=34613 RepID=A0A6B0TYT5_IXORI
MGSVTLAACKLRRLPCLSLALLANTLLAFACSSGGGGAHKLSEFLFPEHAGASPFVAALSTPHGGTQTSPHAGWSAFRRRA